MRAAVMCLVNNSGEITNGEIQNAMEITMRTIQRTRKSLEKSKDPRGTIESATLSSSTGSATWWRLTPPGPSGRWLRS